MPYHPDELVGSVSPATILLPVLLPAGSGGGFMRVSEHYRQAHNLKVVGSNPTASTNTLKNLHIAILPDCGFCFLFGVVATAVTTIVVSKVEHELLERPTGHFHVSLRGKFFRKVTRAVAATHEKHSHRT